MNKLWIPIIFLLGAFAVKTSCMKNDKLKALDEVRNGLVGIKGTYEVAPGRIDMHTQDTRWEGVAKPILDGYIEYLEENQDSALSLYQNALVMSDSIYRYGSINEKRKEQIKNLDPLIFQLMAHSYFKKGNKEDSLTAKFFHESAEEMFEEIGYNKDFEGLKQE